MQESSNSSIYKYPIPSALVREPGTNINIRPIDILPFDSPTLDEGLTYSPSLN